MAENKNQNPAGDTVKNILAELKQEPKSSPNAGPAKPAPLEQTQSFGNEVPVDDDFEQFFKKTVAVIPGQEKDLEKDETYYSMEGAEAEKTQGFLAKLLHRGKRQATESLPPQPMAAQLSEGNFHRSHRKSDPLVQEMLKEETEHQNAKVAQAFDQVQKREEGQDEEAAAREKAAKEAEALAEARQQAAELARRQAEEKAAREQARQRAIEQAAKEREQRLAAEKAAKEQAEKAAREHAAEELATQLAAEKAAQEKAEREAAALAAAQAKAAEEARRQQEAKEQEELARKRMEERQAQRASTAQAAQKAIETTEVESLDEEPALEEPTREPEIPSYEQQERRDLGEGDGETMSVKLDLPDTAQEEPEEEEPKDGKSKMREALHLFGFGRDEGEEADEQSEEYAQAMPEEEDRFDRQTSGMNDPETPEELKALLELQKSKTLLRAVLSGIAAAMLIYLGVAARSGTLPLIEMIDPQLAATPFLAVNLGLLLLTAVLNFALLGHGAAGILGHPCGDTMPMLATVGALLQLALFLVKPEWYDPLHITVFAGPAALLLCLNQAGRCVQAASALENCELIQSGVDHEIAAICNDQDKTLRMADGLDEEDPVLLLSRPAGRLQNFLRRSYSMSENESRLQHLAWLLLLCAVLAGGITMLRGGEAAVAVSTAVGVLCLGAPLASVLSSSLPMDLCGKGAARVGAVVPGWESAEELAESNLLHVTSDDLFPAGCIHLHGIKTFRKERIDLAILYAASMAQYSSKGLQDVFMTILQNDARLLYKTEGVTKIAGKGIVGWIDNQRIILGNREMMAEYGIEIPSMDYENRYTKGQRSPVYLAVAGQLFGMFLLSYAPDRTVFSTISMLRAEGYSLLVSSDDFCMTGESIENAYGLSAGEVRLLNNKQKDRLAPDLAFSESADGCLVHLGSLASVAGGIKAAVSARTAARAASVMVTASVAASCLFGVVLAFTGGMAGLVLPAVVLYQAAWCGLTLAAPAMQKY